MIFYLLAVSGIDDVLCDVSPAVMLGDAGNVGAEGVTQVFLLFLFYLKDLLLMENLILSTPWAVSLLFPLYN